MRLGVDAGVLRALDVTDAGSPLVLSPRMRRSFMSF
jgi:hypothetical protein